jgi:hypothetical protein
MCRVLGKLGATELWLAQEELASTDLSVSVETKFIFIGIHSEVYFVLS